MVEQSAGAAVRSARAARGITLRALASKVGVSPATMSAVERDLTPLTVSRLRRIAEALGVGVAELLSPSRDAHGPRFAVAGRPGEPQGQDWRRYDDLSMDPILTGAIRLFVERGFAATSMREIATEAGLSVAGVYHHYPSKERILVEILDITLADLIWRVEAARAEGEDDVASFSLMVEALAMYHVARGNQAFIGATEMRSLTESERQRIAQIRDKVQYALDDQARRCVQAGEFHVDDLRSATRAIATMCTSLPSWFRLGGRIRAEEMAARYARYALSMMGWLGGGMPLRSDVSG